ncbi:MAG: metalloregulator ArsR/SmtB family transcription factor [Spirochaetia bacterium]|nr:metalloregulator ArsR/SmtB family transcription factor [Spirochaetia bacterium]
MDALIESFKALSDPTRIRILNLLSQGELCVCDIMNVLDIPQSTVSRHLSVLKSSRFISSRKQGLWHYYKINRMSELEKDLFAILEKYREKDSYFSKDIKTLKLKCSCDDKSGCK